MTKGVSRRAFVTGAVGLGAGVAVGKTITAGAEPAPAGPASAYPFHGRHQQGVLTPIQRHSAFVALDTTVTTPAELAQLFQTITARARFLTAGGRPRQLGISAPPSDNGILGPEVVPDGLTITVSVGAALFDERYGLAARRPAKLTAMPAFPNDALRSELCGGDLLLQLCGNEVDVVLHALRDITKATRGGLQVRWRQDGWVSPPRPSGTPRNLMGFKDGTANLAPTDAGLMSELVWVRGGAAGEPGWTDGGSYHVVRLIRMLVEFWDRVNIREQENMIGRRRDTGAPNTGDAEFDPPNFVSDPSGEVIPLNAHIRLANPRVRQTESSRILRRPYNYDNGLDHNGQLDQGLVFVAFNQDIERQFATVQRRLVDEPLVDYISPFGGGYFFAVPGVRNRADWYASQLFS